MSKPNAILYGPFVGELYWEAGRFAPMAIHMAKTSKGKAKNAKIIIFTREERFDLYGKHADILVPLRLPDDYKKLRPNCFKLNGLKLHEFKKLTKQFRDAYEKRFNILNHVYPNTAKGQYDRKNQFAKQPMDYDYAPRNENYKLVDGFLPLDERPIVILAPRYRNGFKRNWSNWQEFYDLIYNDSFLQKRFKFVICGKKEEYIGDKKDRFYDMTKIQIGKKSSLVGVLLVILQRAYFTFGSQSAIPNLSLLHGVEVLEFGCQKTLHTKTYNVKNTPVKFIVNPNYNLGAKVAFNELRAMLKNKLKKEKKL